MYSILTMLFLSQGVNLSEDFSPVILSNHQISSPNISKRRTSPMLADVIGLGTIKRFNIHAI